MTKIKLAYISGLRDFVLRELSQFPSIEILEEKGDCIYIKDMDDFALVKSLKSIARVYLVVEDKNYNPAHISKHKSILGDLIQRVLEQGDKKDFKTFKITCAGEESAEVKKINKYIEDTFSLEKKEEADLKIHIIKNLNIWEVGLQITPRPLSLRTYRAMHMSGAMDPTVAWALNSMCILENKKTYLNVFSGSGTLAIEAGLVYPNLEKIVGFDKDKEHLSLSIQNIKKAKLIKKIQIKEADIFDKPELGFFDVIVSDLPFGMAISKGEDLNILYQSFIKYAEEFLNSDGVLGVYTSEYKILKEIINKSKFKIQKELMLKIITKEDSYLPVKIMILGFKNYK